MKAMIIKKGSTADTDLTDATDVLSKRAKNTSIGRVLTRDLRFNHGVEVV